MMRTSLKRLSSIIAKREAISLDSAMCSSQILLGTAAPGPENRASSHPAPHDKNHTNGHDEDYRSQGIHKKTG
jgi:hypothetical protein